MRRIKKILLAIVIVLIVLQFVQPARNKSGQVLQTDMANSYHVPREVQAIFKTACYDCHSNNTHYPWYATIQPVGWLLANHIKEGKAELNFSELGSYSARRQVSKLKAIENSVKDGSMPLSSYTFLHRDAKLTKENKALIIEWATSTRARIETNKLIRQK